MLNYINEEIYYKGLRILGWSSTNTRNKVFNYNQQYYACIAKQRYPDANCPILIPGNQFGIVDLWEDANIRFIQSGDFREEKYWKSYHVDFTSSNASADIRGRYFLVYITPDNKVYINNQDQFDEIFSYLNLNGNEGFIVLTQP